MSVLNPVPKYPRNKETVRPYRLWDAKGKRQMPYRFYLDLRRAHMGALIETRWSEVNRTIEVFDIRNGRLKGQYTRKTNNVEFMEA